MTFITVLSESDLSKIRFFLDRVENNTLKWVWFFCEHESDFSFPNVNNIISSSSLLLHHFFETSVTHRYLPNSLYAFILKGFGLVGWLGFWHISHCRLFHTNPFYICSPMGVELSGGEIAGRRKRNAKLFERIEHSGCR